MLIIAWLRPKIDWRCAAAGLAVALLTMAPYLWLQQQTGWADFKQAMNTVGGGQKWEQLHGVTTHPVTGYRLPSKQNVSYSLSIMNGERIEDVLGISAAPEFDPQLVWAHKPGGANYFIAAQTLGDWPLVLQQLAFGIAFVLAGVLAFKGVQKMKVENEEARRCWILVMWIVVPLLVFTVAGLWTYLTYFAILFPVHYLVCGLGAEHLARKIKPTATYGLVGALAVGNLFFMLDYFRFVEKNGGAQGTFGTALGYKQEAARYLAEQGGAPLRNECVLQLDLATARTQQEQVALGQRLGQPQLLELGHAGKPELLQTEYPLLIMQQPPSAGSWPTNLTVFLIDGNREAIDPAEWQQLARYPSTNFGPIKLYFVPRNR